MPYVPEAKDGYLKHTFTGLRKTFPNLLIHKIMNEAIFPFRIELMRRTEGGGASIMEDSLRVYMLDSLKYLSDQVKTHANTVVFDPMATLGDMKKRRDAFINRMLDRTIQPEDEVRKPEWTHSDELIEAADLSFLSITINFEGDKDLDWVQPTRERVPHPIMREIMIGLDKLVVAMSQSHSSQNPRCIIADEAARWNLDILQLYAVVDNYDPGNAVFNPTAMSLNERENMFNADGSFDVPVTKGTPTGELLNTPLVNFDKTVQNDSPGGVAKVDTVANPIASK